MARTNTKTTTQVNSWDKELAEQAALSMGQEAASIGGQFFSLRSGILSFDGVALPGNEMAVIILDGILENVLYKGAFDAENPTPPNCFAFGRDEKEMAPHEAVIEPEHEQCVGCPNNEWGSQIKNDGSQGRGKACRNTRRIAVIIAGNFLGGQFQPIKDKDHFDDAKIAYMKLPVTSVKGYAGYVKSIGSAHARPPHGMITRIKVVPDPNNQFSVQFEALAKVPNELMEIVMRRHKDAKDEIEFPYQPMPEVVAPVKKAPARGRAAAAPAAPAKRGAAPAKAALPPKRGNRF
jgi:hypothetical protein